MQAQRTFPIAVLALVVGVILGAIFCIFFKKKETLKQTNYVVGGTGRPYLTVVAGNIITWKRQSPTIKSFTVTVQTGMCEPGQFVDQGNGKMTGTAVGDGTLVCKIADQGGRSHLVPPTYILGFETTVEGPNIAGSCQGCAWAIGQDPGDQIPSAAVEAPATKASPQVATTQNQPPFQIYCTDAPLVPIVIPSTVTVNQWVQPGVTTDWSVQFNGDTPCSNGSKFSDYDSCYLDTASLKKDYPYQYTATLNSCATGQTGSKTPSGTFMVHDDALALSK